MTRSLAVAFGVMQRESAQALIVQTNPFAANNRKRIVELAAQHRLPTMFESRAFVDEGGINRVRVTFPSNAQLV